MSDKERIKCKRPAVATDRIVDDEFCMYSKGLCSLQEIEAPRKPDSSGSAEFDLLTLPKSVAEDIFRNCWDATSKLESQVGRNDELPDGYKDIVKKSFDCLRELEKHLAS